ncbi:MAG TPA: hypothetical protein VEP89_05480 [Draconibacterium sp.]|nr:hypothetical protein [Draconibacterium sp.]
MKIKILFWSGLLFIAMISCEEAETDFLTATDISIEIPLTTHLSEQPEPSETSFGEFNFTGISVFCLGYSNELKNCPGDIVQISPEAGALISFEALNNSETISELQLVLAYKTQSDFEYKNIQTLDLLQSGNSLNSETLSVHLDDLLSQLINRMNENPRYFIMIQLTGKANFNIETDAMLNIPLLVESEYHSPRFTL